MGNQHFLFMTNLCSSKVVELAFDAGKVMKRTERPISS
jgi:hypothetical protein